MPRLGRRGHGRALLLHTSDVDGTVQQRVIASLPAAAKYGLEPPPRSVRMPARELTDGTRLADVLAEHAGAYPGASGPVILALWWYLASAVLVGPPAAGALLGVPLSGALDDLELHLGPVGMPAAAVSSAIGPPDPGPALGAALATLVDTGCSVGGLRPRPLWALAIDSLADRLLTFGRAIGGVPRASALATELTISTGAPVPPPRFFDVTTDAGTDDRRSARRTARFLIRTSCCLLHRIPTGDLCTACPRRTPELRRHMLTAMAGDFV